MLKARIIILRTIKHSESDLLIQSIDSFGNKLHFLAKSALKSKKRFGGGVLEPTHYLDVLYKEARVSDGDPLHILLEAKVIRDFQGLRSNYDRLVLALSFLELVQKLTRAGAVGAKEIFDLLGHALSACETSENPQNLKLQFQAKLLYSQGVLEQFEEMAPLIRTSLKNCDELQISSADRRLLQTHLEVATEEMFR